VVPTLVPLARAPVEFGEAEVAMRDERAHVAGLGERERLTVGVLGLLARRRLPTGGQVADQVEGVGLHITPGLLATHGKRFPRAPFGVLRAPGRQVGVSQ